MQRAERVTPESKSSTFSQLYRLIEKKNRFRSLHRKNNKFLKLITFFSEEFDFLKFFHSTPLYDEKGTKIRNFRFIGLLHLEILWSVINLPTMECIIDEIKNAHYFLNSGL